MKLTPEKLEELKETAEEGKTFLTFDPQAVLDLIADLEEARGMVVTLAPDALREAEERKNIAAGLEVVWQGHCGMCGLIWSDWILPPSTQPLPRRLNRTARMQRAGDLLARIFSGERLEMITFAGAWNLSCQSLIWSAAF